MKQHIRTLLGILMALTVIAILAACADPSSNSTETTGTPDAIESETNNVNNDESNEESNDMIDTTPETEGETFDYSPYKKELGFALLCEKSMSNTLPFQVTPAGSFGSVISVKQDCFLTSLNVLTHNYSDNIGEMDFSIWRWTGNYKATVSAEPVFTYHIQDPIDNSRVTVDLSEANIGEGEWYYAFHGGSENAIGINVVNGRISTTDADDVSVLKTYQDGTVVRNCAPNAYVTYDKYDTSKLAGEASYTQLTEGKAHVILLGGQSNASGISLKTLLENHYDDEQLARFQAGYSNVLIDYFVDSGSNVSNGFVPVKLGQGNNANAFGPEVGLADYLSRTYPGEKFYIIKATGSGSSLFGDWAEEGSTYPNWDAGSPDYGKPISTGQTYKNFINHVSASLTRMKNAGLEPEIFAMMWMQGETDSWFMDKTTAYASSEAALLARINAEFGDYMAEGGMAFLDAAIYDGPQSPWTYATMMNYSKQAHASTSDNYYFLDTNALGLDPCDEISSLSDTIDIAHYDSDDMIQLGELFGKGIEQILKNAGYPAN